MSAPQREASATAPCTTARPQWTPSTWAAASSTRLCSRTRACRSFENVNCRYDDELAAIPLREAYDLVVTDCSFISLTKLLPAIWRGVDAGGDLMCLVAPQFECGPDIVRRGRGVVRDPADRQAAVDAIIAFAREGILLGGQSSTTPLSRQFTIAAAERIFIAAASARHRDSVGSAGSRDCGAVQRCLVSPRPWQPQHQDGLRVRRAAIQTKARSSPTPMSSYFGRRGRQRVGQVLATISRRCPSTQRGPRSRRRIELLEGVGGEHGDIQKRER